MIRTEVEGYCHECMDFKPDVERPERMLDEIYGEVYQTDTVIRCANKYRCEAIKRYLEKKVKNNKEPEDDFMNKPVERKKTSIMDEV